MARYLINGFKNALAAASIDFDNDVFKIHLCTGAPGSVSTLTNEASIANSVHSETVTITRTGNNVNLTSGTITGLDTAATPYAVLVDTTANVCIAYWDGLSLDPDGNNISFSQSATLLVIGG